jgi:hypothetical protein
MRRPGTLLTAPVVAAALILAAAAPASADKPLREPFPAEDITITGSCDFDVRVHTVENKEFITSYFDDDGNLTRQIVNGRLVLELTNQEKPAESIVYNVSGPVFLTFFEDGSLDFVLGGRSLLFFFPGEVEDLPLVFVNSGQVTIHIDPEGNTVGVDQVGDVEDVCAALA